MSRRGAEPSLWQSFKARISLRALTQWAALIGFMLLYARTAYRGADEITWPVHLVFRLDPLAMLTELMAQSGVSDAGGFLLRWLGAFALLGLTLGLGRFFCGWLCPLGTLLEYTGPTIRRLGKRAPPFSRPTTLLPVSLLTALLTATALGTALLGFFDPLSILLRSLTVAIFPAFDYGVKETFAAIFGLNSAAVNSFADPVYSWLSEWLLAFGRPLFLVSGVTAALFGALFALELLAPRFWCAHLCPLGALLGIAAKVGLTRRARASECGKCSICVSNCPTSAVGEGAGNTQAEPLLCIQCNTCARDCPQGAMGIVAGAASYKQAAPAAPARRAVVGSMVAGVALAAFGGARAGEKRREWGFLRPPGSVGDEEFNRRCIRCGACMRVCPSTALHPSFAEAGLGGIWTPRLVPRVGYCEYHCRLCGQVCPTGAIQALSEGEKEKWVIGIAVLDKNHCLPYRSATGCIVCEEHCPTSPKAILFEEREGIDAQGRTVLLKFPKVVEERCIGCGICETKCPLEGRSAIVVGREAPASEDGVLGY